MENIIKIHIKKQEDYKNTYNERILSYELSNYILEELKGIDVKRKIKFIISSDFNMEELEKNNLVDMIRNNYGADISEIINLSKKEQLANYIILLIGIIFLTLYSILEIELLSEFILILGWVFIGESICNFLYKGIDKKHKILRRKQIVNEKVLFKEEKNNS